MESGNQDYGSGTTSGTGFGNKTAGGDDSYDNSGTRFGTSSNTDSYSGGTDVGSGTTGKTVSLMILRNDAYDDTCDRWCWLRQQDERWG
jgi:hypothetical protein